MIRSQQRRHVLGSEAYVTLVGETEEQMSMVHEDIWQTIRLFEHTFSRFLPDSEISYVNSHAGLPTLVTPEFTALARTARQYAEQTGGLYNPFVLPVLQRSGYRGSWPSPDTLGVSPDYTDRRIVKASDLIVESRSVTIPSAAALDFGGIGKGYALDEIARLLAKRGVANYWVSLGGDVLAHGEDDDGRSWYIDIEAADDINQTVSRIVVDKRTRAVATSGTLKRAGEGWNHLIDPRTGRSTESDIVSVTVAASTGTAADIYAKCLLLEGSIAAPQLAVRLKIRHYCLQIRRNNGIINVIKKGGFV